VIDFTTEPVGPPHPGHHQGQPVLAFAYNIAALPLAALGLLNPLIAGIAVTCSSMFVVFNSLRLRRFRGATPEKVC
jgi:Cu+-exporting ATPase